MDEAERLCDRVAIVDHGKVIALGSPRELIARLGGEHVIEFTLMNGESPNGQTIDLTGRARRTAGRDVGATRSRNTTRCPSLSPHVALPACSSACSSGQLELASLTTRHASLEDVFVTLTGRHLRDEETQA